MSTHKDAFNQGLEIGQAILAKTTGFALKEVFLSMVQDVYQTLLENLSGIDIELKHAEKNKEFEHDGVEIILSRRKKGETNTTIERLAQIHLRTEKADDEFLLMFESLNADCYRARDSMLGTVIRQSKLSVVGTKIGDHYSYQNLDKALTALGALVSVSLMEIPLEKRINLKPKP